MLVVKLHYEQGKNNYRYLIFSITVLKRLFRYGGWVTISNIISPILASMDRFILSHIQGASKISFYTVPNELVTRLGIVPGSLGKAVFPKLSHARNFTASYAEQKKLIY